MKIETRLLEAALVGYQHQADTIKQRMAELRLQLAGQPAIKTVEKKPKKRKMSTAARKRIATAQKKRWKEFHRLQQAG